MNIPVKQFLKAFILYIIKNNFSYKTEHGYNTWEISNIIKVPTIHTININYIFTFYRSKQLQYITIINKTLYLFQESLNKKLNLSCYTRS